MKEIKDKKVRSLNLRQESQICGGKVNSPTLKAYGGPPVRPIAKYGGPMIRPKLPIDKPIETPLEKLDKSEETEEKEKTKIITQEVNITKENGKTE